MTEVNIIVCTVSGTFLSLAYLDLYYDIIAILVLLEELLMLKSGAAKGQNGRPAYLGMKSPAIRP